MDHRGGGPAVGRANDIAPGELHGEGQRVDGREQQAQERPFDSGRFDRRFHIPVVLRDHIGLNLRAVHHRTRGQEHDAPHSGATGGGQQRRDIHAVGQHQEDRFDTRNGFGQSVFGGEVTRGHLHARGQPGRFGATGQRTHRQARGQQGVHGLAAEVSGGANDEVHKFFPSNQRPESVAHRNSIGTELSILNHSRAIATCEDAAPG
nr:hypothetical protein [Nocardia crassostreae]